MNKQNNKTIRNNVAFTTSTPIRFSNTKLQHQFHLSTCRRRATPLSSLSNNNQQESSPFKPLPSQQSPSLWPTMRQVIRTSALSAAMLFAPIFSPASPTNSSFSRIRSPTAIAATTATPAKKLDTNTTSDVEAAAMTLGAVTIGAVLMRTVVHARRDEDAERARVAAECERLAKEEEERARRIERKRMEAVDLSDQNSQLALDDNDLMSALRKRVKTLEDEDETDNQQEDNTDDNNTHMRHNPIPDRGTGSALLERPDDDNDDQKKENESEQEEPNDETEKPQKDELEMLNRMWNLSPPDKE